MHNSYTSIISSAYDPSIENWYERSIPKSFPVSISYIVYKIYMKFWTFDKSALMKNAKMQFYNKSIIFYDFFS